MSERVITSLASLALHSSRSFSNLPLAGPRLPRVRLDSRAQSLRFFHSLRRFPTPRASGYFPQRRSRRSARTSVCTVSHFPSSKTDGSRDGRSHPRRERGARGAHAPFGEIGESARSRRHAGVRRASPRRRRRRRERALPQGLAQAGYRPRGRRGACALPTANRRKRPASFGLSGVPLCSYRV